MVQDVLEKLTRVKKSGTNWVALCPSHEDSRQSLSIAEGRDGRVLLYCFKGCTFKEIIGSLRMNAQDLFKDKQYRRKNDYDYDYDY